VGGIFIRSFFNIDVYEISLVFFLGIVFLIFWKRKKFISENNSFLTKFFLIGLFMIFISAGLFRFNLADTKISTLSSFINSEVVLDGVVVREPDIREKIQYLYVNFDEINETVLVSVDKYKDFSYGNRVSVSGNLVLPESFETDLGRIFNYPGYLKARGVTYLIKFADVELLAEDEGNFFLTFLFKGKSKFTNIIEQIIPEPEVGLSEGLLLGMKRALGEDLEEVFRRTGIIHIVVLSGYNVMIVAEAIMRLLSFFLTPRARLFVGIGAIASFALLVGLSPTVVRASIMAVFVLIARTTGRLYAVMRGLMIAGVIMLIINPYLLLYDPGFQLSFLATLGLILFAPLIESKLQLVPTRFQIREFLTATIATQIFVSPLLLYLMGSISIIAVFVNVLVLPAVPLAMFLTFITGLIGLVSGVAGQIVGFGAYISLLYIISIAELFAKISFATVSVSNIPFILVVILYGGFGYFLFYIQKQDYKENVDDQFADWTIKEERDLKKDVSSTSSSRSPFPFK